MLGQVARNTTVKMEISTFIVFCFFVYYLPFILPALHKIYVLMRLLIHIASGFFSLSFLCIIIVGFLAFLAAWGQIVFPVEEEEDIFFDAEVEMDEDDNFVDALCGFQR